MCEGDLHQLNKKWKFHVLQLHIRIYSNSSRINQLDATCYFIFVLIDSTCFGHEYAHHQEFATMLLNYHIGRFVLGLLCVGG